MKCQDLFSLKNKKKKKKFECRLLQILLGALRVNIFIKYRNCFCIQIGRMVCFSAETFRGLALLSLAFGGKILASLELSSRVGAFISLIPFFSFSITGRQLDMTEILLTVLLNLSSKQMQKKIVAIPVSIH